MAVTGWLLKGAALLGFTWSMRADVTPLVLSKRYPMPLPLISPPLLALLILVLSAMNGLTWGVYRYDKAQARRRGRRVPERTLLTLAALGGLVGAFVGVYGHRQRHKAHKPSFLVPLYLIAAVEISCGALLLWSRTF